MASIMPSGSAETFTGTDGSAPNATNVTQALNEGSGGGLSIQSNRLRIRTGTAQGDRTSWRVTGLSVADVEAVFTWTVAAGLYGQVMLRSTNPIDTGTGYQLSLVASDMTLARRVSYSGPNLQTASHGFTAGQVVRTRVAVFGQTIYARTWLAANPEPTSTWQLIYSDPTGSGGISAAGAVGWTVSSASAGSKDLLMDDVNVFSTLTPVLATLTATGSIGLAGDVTRQARKVFASSITPTGALARVKVVARIFAGALTPAGVVKRSAGKALAGIVTLGGATQKRPAKNLSGSIAPAALLRRRANKRLAGSISPIGTGITSNVGRIFGRPGQAVMRLVERAEVRIRHRRG